MGQQDRQPNGKRREPINSRLRPDVRRALETSAMDNGRNLSGEIEHRLEESWSHERLVGDLRQIIREEVRAALGPARKPCGRETGANCPNHSPFAHQCACEGVHQAVPMRPDQTPANLTPFSPILMSRPART